jgi:lipopolysaccharide/colanic/teichoic acid biosynthesis glycosyltransferase/acetyltransferase-like isoleucine patch superfamily enzyme
MNLIIIHNNSDQDRNSQNLLRFALSHEPLAGVVLDGLGRYLYWNTGNGSWIRYRTKYHPKDIFFAVPEQWNIVPPAPIRQAKTIPQSFYHGTEQFISYTNGIQLPSNLINRIEEKNLPGSWLVLSNGRFAAKIDPQLLGRVLSEVRADIVAVNATPELLSEQEKLRLTPEENIAGFRRLYSDTAELTAPADNWPHHLFIKAYLFKKLFADRILPGSFSTLVERCRSNALVLRTVNIGGSVLDLNMDNGMLEFYKMILTTTPKVKFKIQKSNKISEDSRFIGTVLLGENVRIGPRVIIAGPTIIGQNAYIEEGATINSSIIGPEVHVPQNQVVNNAVYQQTQTNRTNSIRCHVVGLGHDTHSLMSMDTMYRRWSWFSYARCLKRIADYVLAALVLTLFAPLIPFIALAIKLSSPGPVFFKDKRQGLHGKEFNCLKFRTMVAGADKIQEKLRFVSQVDGPQFKMVNDPRISAVGRFLRETYIDEIPQFINVLLGQMSVVGPRPSPESENTLCPLWREARLSVRPGITGLWQILRTRIPTKDFQEWIRYDTEYVRNLSLRMDLWICWQTIKKLVEDFMNQF